MWHCSGEHIDVSLGGEGEAGCVCVCVCVCVWDTCDTVKLFH